MRNIVWPLQQCRPAWWATLYSDQSESRFTGNILSPSLPVCCYPSSPRHLMVLLLFNQSQSHNLNKANISRSPGYYLLFKSLRVIQQSSSPAGQQGSRYLNRTNDINTNMANMYLLMNIIIFCLVFQLILSMTIIYWNCFFKSIAE